MTQEASEYQNNLMINNPPSSVTPPPKATIKGGIHWFKHLPKNQKVSAIALLFLVLVIPVSVFATFYQIRMRSKASPLTPPTSLPITPPEQLVNAVLTMTDSSFISAVNTATVNPDRTGATIEFWFNYTQPVAGQSSLAYFSDNGRFLAILLNTSSPNAKSSIGIKLPPWENQPATSLSSPADLQPNTWYHLAFVYNHSSKMAALFINGKQIDTASYKGVYNLLETVPHIQIGSTRNVTDSTIPGINGRIEDFRLSTTHRYIDNFQPMPFNQLSADEFTSVLWKFNRSNTDNGVYNITWFPDGEVGYNEPADEPQHSVCSQQQSCVMINGVGDSQCHTDADCAPKPPILVEIGCKVGGCSGEICTDEKNNVVSICVYKDEYACYKQNVRCEKQASGKCGWTQTPELLACLGITPTPTPTPTATPTITPTPTPTPRPTDRPNNNDNQSKATGCQDNSPTKSADLYQINASKTDATLYFAPAGQPYTHYIVQFGEGEVMQHSASFDAQNATGALTADIHLLKPNTVYSFQILAFNHCAPGEWSNRMTIRTTAGTNRSFYKNVPLAIRTNLNRVLGVFSKPSKVAPTKLNPVETPSQPTPIPQTSEPYESSYQPPQPQPNLIQRLIQTVTQFFSRK